MIQKQRYEILDGLRGVAAILVIFFHCFETYSWQWGEQIINHGYLAVDFFFVLSGFVIGYAYDDRWTGPDRMTTWAFFKRRLIRLHPMVVMGTLIGAALFFFRQSEMFPVGQTEGWMFALVFVMCLLMIPCTPKMGLSMGCWDEMNPLNGPTWSLTFEYIANVIYAFLLRRLPTIAIGVLCALSAVLTLDLTLGWDMFGLFPEGPHYTVIGGWCITGPQIYIGFTRLAYPFLTGYLISRLLATPKSRNPFEGKIKGGFWWCALILAVCLCVPQVGGNVRGIADGAYQAVVILAVFPLVILMGAGSNLGNGKSRAICKWLGEISFPLYITHYPLMYCQMSWASTHADAPAWQHLVVNGSVVIVSIAVAWACVRLYDTPVRAWLSSKLLRGQRSSVAGV